MKIAILGDTHFGVRNDNLKFHDFYRKFYTNVFFPYLRENRIANIIQLGDLFDRRKYVNFNTLYLSRQYFFDVIEKENFYMDVFPGNHDILHKNTLEVNALDLLLGEYKQISVVSKPTTLKFDNKNIDLIPWICDDNEDEILSFLHESKSKVCMGHFEIQGFEMHKGHVCDTGFPRDAFSKFDLTLSGHYHTRSEKENITYVGTPYEMTWSDYGDQKGFHILDTETLDLTYIKNPYRMFNKVHYDDTNKQLKDLLNKDFDVLEGTYVKVIVSGKTNPYWFDVFIDTIEKSSPAHIQVVDDNLKLDTESEDHIIDEAEDTVTILQKYIDNLDVDVSKPQLNTVIRSLYNEAINL